ncbi:MAG TPA: hypothetical protein VGK01_15550 [Candidatus Angelobacter sp.]
MPDNPVTSLLWPADNPAVAAHMNMLQGIISRLANNSASSKTWCLTLVGALVSLTGATHVSGIVTFALVPIVIFGFMDTMYLAQEKAYRDVHAHIVKRIRDGSYSISDAYDAKAPMALRHVGYSLASWSIFPVYGGLILMYFIARCAGWVAVLSGHC